MDIRTQLKAGSACYIVQPGDSQAKIAQQFYGSSSTDNLHKIYYSNFATLSPNTVIHPGDKLFIPD